MIFRFFITFEAAFNNYFIKYYKDAFLEKPFDFSKAVKNPYAKEL